MAKLINIVAPQLDSPEKYIRKEKQITHKGIPSIAVPTTAGTGSEATHFAVVYLNGVKYSLAHEEMLPDYCILDPQFTMQLPKYITACTAMDAFSQAVESFWSVNSTEESKNYSKKAIRLFLDSIDNVISRNPKKEERENMLIASNYAGKAINITKTTAPHALSYKITSSFKVPHGHAVALTLPNMSLYNSNVAQEDCNDKRGALYVKDTMEELLSMLVCSNFLEARDFINELIDRVGLERDLRKLGIHEEFLVDIANSVNEERLKNNPRQMDKLTLKSFLKELFY